MKTRFVDIANDDKFFVLPVGQLIEPGDWISPLSRLTTTAGWLWLQRLEPRNKYVGLVAAEDGPIVMRESPF